MNNHTPGPWTINEGFITGRFNADGEVHDVCDPRCAPPEADFLGEMDANERLIAAAPELLMALQSLMADLQDSGEDANEEGEEYDACILARAALAKATEQL